MKKLQRYDPPRSYTKPIPWIKDEDGDWCDSDDVAMLEASHAELKTALEYAINIYGRFGAVVNEPYNPGVWIDVAKRAIENAEDITNELESRS